MGGPAFVRRAKPRPCDALLPSRTVPAVLRYEQHQARTTQSERRPASVGRGAQAPCAAPNPDLAPLDGIDSDGRQRGLTADCARS